MDIRDIFRKRKASVQNNPDTHPLIGLTVTHYREIIPSHPVEVVQLISSPAVVKTVKPNGNLVLTTVTPDGLEEVGEYRQITPNENYYTRIDRPGNPHHEEVTF